MDVTFDLSGYSIYFAILHFNAFLNTLVTIVVFFVLIRHTNKAMKVYKYFLFNIALCSYMLDMFTTLILVPLPIFPLYGGCSFGLLNHLLSLFDSYQSSLIYGWIVFIQLLSMMGISLLLAFLFRLAAVYGRADLFNKKSIIFAMAFMQLFYVTPCIYTSFAIHSTEDTVLNYISLNHPKMLNFFKSQPCFLLAIDTNVFTYFLVSVSQIMFLTIIYTATLICIFHGLRQIKGKKSVKTYRLQRSLTITLGLQFALPICMFVIALMSVSITSILRLHVSQAICCAGFLFCSLHTTVNGLIMLMLIRPYREFLIKQWKIIFLREKVQRVFYSK